MTTYVSAGYTRLVSWSTAMTNAAFQDFCTKVKAAIDGAGLIQTSDTGQLNPATVTFPGTASTDAGYFVYRFNDSQQGTDPVFLKFRLGRGGQTSETRILVDVGQGSNGSGTITGTSLVSIPVGTSYETANVNPSVQDFSCHTTGFFSMYIGARGVNAGTSKYRSRHWMMIERTRDQTTGNFDGVGVVVFTCQGNKFAVGPTTMEASSYFIPWTGGHATTIANMGDVNFCMPVATLRLDDNNELIAWPHFYRHGDVFKKCWARWTGWTSDFSDSATVITASPYGTARNWMALGNGLHAPWGTSLNEPWTTIGLWE